MPSSSSILLLIALLTLLLPVHARLAKRDEINYFTNPPSSGAASDFSDNPVYTIGSVIDLGWVTDYPSVSLQLCQQYTESASCYPLFRSQAAVTSAQWTVSLGSSGFDLETSPIFYFEVNNGPTDSTELFTCHYFTIKASGSRTTQSVVTATVNPSAVANPSSSVAPILQTLTYNPDITLQAALASAAPTSSSSSSTTRTSATGGANSASQTSKPSSSGLSQGAKIGIGVGVGVGLLLGAIGALVGLCFWRRGKRKSTKMEEHQHDPFLPPGYHPGSDGAPTPYSAHPKYVPMQEYGQQHEQHGGELPANERPQEMSSDERAPMQEMPGSQPYQAYRPDDRK